MINITGRLEQNIVKHLYYIYSNYIDKYIQLYRYLILYQVININD